MAKIYGEIASSGLMTFVKSYSRANGQPLDSTQVFYSLASAEQYAAKNPLAYAGQQITVVIAPVYSNWTFSDDAEHTMEYDSTTFSWTLDKGTDGAITVEANEHATSIDFGDGLVATRTMTTAHDVKGYLINVDGSLQVLASGSSTEDVKDYVDQRIDALDATLNTATTTDGTVNVVTGITQTDGKLTQISEQKLQKVAVTGKAEDVSIADTDELFTGTNVEEVSKEIFNRSKVAVTSAAGTEDDVLKTYTITQDGKELAKIDIPKELVVEEGKVIKAAEATDETKNEVIWSDIPGATVDNIGDSYIRLKITNQTSPIYIAAKDLVDIYTGGTNTQTTVTVVDNVISVEITSVDSGLVKVGEKTLTTKLSEIDNSISTLNGDENVDGSVAKAVADAKSEIIGGVDDIVGSDTIYGVRKEIAVLDESLSDVATSGSATDVNMSTAIDNKTTVEEVLHSIDGRVKANKQALDVLNGDGDGSVKKAITTVIEALDSEVGEEVVEEGTTVAVLAKVSQVDGQLDRDSSVTVSVDKAGTAEQAKQDVIGKSGDLSTAETIYGAKKYADEKTSAVQTNLTALSNKVGTLPSDATTVVDYAKQQADKKMEFYGIVTEMPTTGTVGGVAVNDGAVIIYNNNSYVWDADSSQWRSFADNNAVSELGTRVTSLETNKVDKTTTIAGVDLQDNITKAELLTAINVADGAQVNVIEKVVVGDTELAVADKTVTIQNLIIDGGSSVTTF